MKWRPETHDDYDALKGFEVYTADNVRVGPIMHVFHPNDELPERDGGHYFLVEPDTPRNPFNSDAVFFQETTIRDVDLDADVVLLEAPADELHDQRMHRPSDFDRFRRT